MAGWAAYDVAVATERTTYGQVAFPEPNASPHGTHFQLAHGASAKPATRDRKLIDPLLTAGAGLLPLPTAVQEDHHV